jgi:hypothetical protein
MPTNDDKNFLNFIEEVSGEVHLRVEENLGGGYVRLRSAEAERRQAKHDIRSVEDVVIELLRNSRDAGANNIFMATTRDGDMRLITVLDDGLGMPPDMAERIFEPRVTSKLDSMVMDEWGVHGRGMALFSIKSNCDTACVLSTGEHKGSAILIRANTAALPEKSDQSTLPLVEKHVATTNKDNTAANKHDTTTNKHDTTASTRKSTTNTSNSAANATASNVTASNANLILNNKPKPKYHYDLRGPHNIARTVVEFALASRHNISVFMGSPSEIAACLMEFGVRSVAEEELLFANDIDALPVCCRLATCGDAAGLQSLCATLGLEISERTAHRILSGQIAPVTPLLDSVMPRLRKDDSRTATDLLKDNRGLRIAPDDLNAFARELEKAFELLAERYYLSLRDLPKIRVKGDAVTVRFDVEKEL